MNSCIRLTCLLLSGILFPHLAHSADEFPKKELKEIQALVVEEKYTEAMAKLDFLVQRYPKVGALREIRLGVAELEKRAKEQKPRRDFARDPAGHYGTADGRMQLEIKKTAEGLRATLTSFGKVYPLNVTMSQSRALLANADKSLEVEAEWDGSQLILKQGSSRKVLTELSR